MALKICVYAISKNEEKHAARWMESMQEADGIFVLDTGSSDATVKALRRLGAHVSEKVISPWRFDRARNEALSLVDDDADICVAADLDEMFTPGWRARLEEAWHARALRARFKFVWSFRPDGSEGTVLWLDKIHARHGYHWKYPVHEVLERDDLRPECADEVVTVSGMQLNHRPDLSKSRAQYLPLLETAALENPLDARCLHYLGREYLYSGRWDECVRTLQRHISLPGSLWREEKCASMRYIAQALWQKGDFSGALSSLFGAIAQAPHLREAYYEAAKLLYHLGNNSGALFMAELALSIKERPKEYMTEDEAWSDAPEFILRSAKARLKNEICSNSSGN